MKTKLVYVIVSDENDFYLEQAYVSMSSARYHMPDVHIVLVMDAATFDNLNGFRKAEALYADETVVVELDRSFPAKKRSRLLKTSLRNIVDGDFLYVDCDTVITGDLRSIDSLNIQFGAVRDRHFNLDSNPFRFLILPDLERLGVKAGCDYYNGGVLYVKDKPETRHFFELWNRNYISGYGKGVSQDQPSLAQTNNATNLISPLEDTWNCQIRNGLHYLKEAKIWHYFSSSTVYILNNPECLMQIRKQETIPENILSTFHNPFLGFPDKCQIISGKEIDFFASKDYYELKNLLFNDTIVGKFIKEVLRINEKYYSIKKSFLKDK